MYHHHTVNDSFYFYRVHIRQTEICPFPSVPFRTWPTSVAFILAATISMLLSIDWYSPPQSENIILYYFNNFIILGGPDNLKIVNSPSILISSWILFAEQEQTLLFLSHLFKKNISSLSISHFSSQTQNEISTWSTFQTTRNGPFNACDDATHCCEFHTPKYHTLTISSWKRTDCHDYSLFYPI